MKQKTWTAKEIELALSDTDDEKVTTDIRDLRRAFADASFKNLLDLTVEEARHQLFLHQNRVA